jgi:hypothetical protein
MREDTQSVEGRHARIAVSWELLANFVAVALAGKPARSGILGDNPCSFT